MAITTTPLSIRNKLDQVIREMEDNINEYVLHPGHDFIRKRLCTFPKMIIGIMSMESHDLDGEILSV